VRAKDALTDYLNSCTTINQREFVGAGRIAKSVSNMANEDSRKFIIALARCVVRLRKTQEFEKELAILTPTFDSCLEKCWTTQKQAGSNISSFFSSYEDICPLVLDSDACERIMKETGSWINVHAELESVCKTSRLGFRLFGWALVQVAQTQFSEVVESHSAQLA
jgi:hypothetical protein